MGFVYEWQIHASCDAVRCNRYEATDIMNMTEFKKYLEDQGWYITKSICLCPDHREFYNKSNRSKKC